MFSVRICFPLMQLTMDTSTIPIMNNLLFGQLLICKGYYALTTGFCQGFGFLTYDTVYQLHTFTFYTMELDNDFYNSLNVGSRCIR